LDYIRSRGEFADSQAVEWTDLNSATTTFLITCLIHLILATQTTSPLFALPKAFSLKRMDDETVTEVFEKALANGELAQGWAVVIRTELNAKKIGKVLDSLAVGEVEAEVVKTGLEIARGVLARAI
jgi:nucleolar MIF4G domain-containing protein 1